MDQTRSAVIRSSILLLIKTVAYTATGSVVLMAALVDSMVDVVASIIAHVVKPKEHHEYHQLAMIQALWIMLGGLMVFVQAYREYSEPVDMALVGVAILVITLVIDGSIVRKLDSSDPVYVD
jgi:ferrous-iron efflux pump FieF